MASHAFLIPSVLVLLLAACSPKDMAEEGAPQDSTGADVSALVEAAQALPSSGGFSPLRPEEIVVPGTGSWICTPAGAGKASRCIPRGAGRPGAVPVPTPVVGPPEAPIEGKPIDEILSQIDTGTEIPMQSAP